MELYTIVQHTELFCGKYFTTITIETHQLNKNQFNNFLCTVLHVRLLRNQHQAVCTKYLQFIISYFSFSPTRPCSFKIEQTDKQSAKQFLLRDPNIKFNGNSQYNFRVTNVRCL